MHVVVRNIQNNVYSYYEDVQFGDWEERYECDIEAKIVDGKYKDGYREDVYELPDAEIVYVVYMRYDSGNSFGRSYNNQEILYAFTTLAKAKAALSVAQANSSAFTFDIENESGKTVKICNPGAGYFEQVTELDIEAIILT